MCCTIRSQQCKVATVSAPIRSSRNIKPTIICITVTLFFTASLSNAAERIYEEATHGRGELRYVNDLPVLITDGTPEQRGEQTAALVGDAARTLVAFPQNLLKRRGHGNKWPAMKLIARGYQEHFPDAHRREMQAAAKGAGVKMDEIAAANVMPDLYRVFGCSSLIVDAEHSATGGPLFGRNLDFYTLETLHKYSIVHVVRPHDREKHAFASIGFPGLIGALSGMNDARLALAVHEVYASGDGSNVRGVVLGTPYTMCFRRILEECETVEQAAELLKEMKRTTLLNLAVCDRKSHAVIEITPKSVVVRRGENGCLPCTNHFVSKDLADKRYNECWRYDILKKAAGKRDVTVEQIGEYLDDVNQGKLTLQTMVFEPEMLRLHLAAGDVPSSKQPLKKIDLAPLLKRK